MRSNESRSPRSRLGPWLESWCETPPPPPPSTWAQRLARSWQRPEPVAPPRPWFRRLPLFQHPPDPPPPQPWYRRLATPIGALETDFEFPSIPRPRLRISSPGTIPLGRALGVPIFLGVFFSLLSLGVGVDLGARVRGWLPHRAHVVRSGETLTTIALDYGIRDWSALYGAGSNARRHPNPNRIPAGARLDLPLHAGFGSLRALSVRIPSCPTFARDTLDALDWREPGWVKRWCDASPRGRSSRSA